MKQLDQHAKYLLAIGGNDSLSALRSAGYSLSALISAGYSLSDLRNAGYSLSAIRSAGYSLSDLRNAGYSLSDLRSAGYSLSDLISAGYSLSDLRSAGYSLSALRSAGYSLSDLRNAGYSLSDLISAGYSLSDLISAGYSLSDLRSAGYSLSALRSAGYSASDLDEYEKDFEKCPTITGFYSRLLKSIEAKEKIHRQSTFGNEEYCESDICGTPMCTAGFLVNEIGPLGYEYKKKYGWKGAATLIHSKTYPNDPCQNFNSIPQDWAMAYIQEMAKKES